MTYSVEYYETPNGTYPAEEFILMQDIKMKAKIFRNLELLEEMGPALRKPISEYLGDDILELRTQVGNNTTRILYFFFIGNRVILTNGFVKKSQKTPIAELELAKKYKQDFIKRKG